MEKELVQKIVEARAAGAEYIHAIHELEKVSQPPFVQELVLARRAAEDARMRLGVALAYLDGQDPLSLR